MESPCTRFTAAEGGARLAAYAGTKNILVTEHTAFISTSVLIEHAHKIRGTLSSGHQRSVYIARRSRIECVSHEFSILTDLSVIRASACTDVSNWQNELEIKEVLVCTSEVLKMILEENILTIPDINVLIIDSCHLIFKDQNLQFIMKLYKQCESNRPRILALTYPLFTAPKDTNEQTAINRELVPVANDDGKTSQSEHVNEANIQIEGMNCKNAEVNQENCDEDILNSEKQQTKDGSCEVVENKKNMEQTSDTICDPNYSPDMNKTIDKVNTGNMTSLNGSCNMDDFDMYEKLEWKIEELEKELCCEMDLAEDIDGGKRLSVTVAKPKELIIEYSPQSPADILPEPYSQLETYMRDTVNDALDFINEHRYDPTEIYGEDMYEEFMNIPDPTIDPKNIFKEFLYVLDQLGPYAADKAAFSLLTKLEKLKIKVPYERHFLLLCLCTSIFVKIRCFADLMFSKCTSDWERITSFSTPKVLRLAEILEQFQPPENLRENEFRSTVNVIRNQIDIRPDINSHNGKADEISGETSESSESISVNIITDLNNRSNNTDVATSNLNGFYSDSKNKTIISKSINGQTRCETAAVTDLNSFDSIYIDVSNNITDLDNNENNNKGMTRSKTNELISAIEKCDFVTLSNKIEDRVNTYEANLKDLDDYVEVICEKGEDVEKQVEICEDRSKISGNEDVCSTNKYIFENIINDKNTVCRADISKSSIDSANKYNRDFTTNGFEKISENINPLCKYSENKSDSCNIDSKIDSERNINESVKLGFGKRSGHRSRGRGRVPRNNTTKIQQMQLNPDALCGIVFMKKALMAKIMFMMIVDMSRSRPSLSHLCAQYCTSEGVGEGKDCQREGKKQEEVLKKFRMHECNLLLATAVLEEGIDLPRCNLVVRWDIPPSYRSHGLCRGRARAPRSAVALLTSSEECSGALHNLAVYKELDQIITRKCGCGIQYEPPQEEENHADSVAFTIKPYVPMEILHSDSSTSIKYEDTKLSSSNEMNIKVIEEVLEGNQCSKKTREKLEDEDSQVADQNIDEVTDVNIPQVCSNIINEDFLQINALENSELSNAEDSTYESNTVIKERRLSKQEKDMMNLEELEEEILTKDSDVNVVNQKFSECNEILTNKSKVDEQNKCNIFIKKDYECEVMDEICMLDLNEIEPKVSTDNGSDKETEICSSVKINKVNVNTPAKTDHGHLENNYNKERIIDKEFFDGKQTRPIDKSEALRMAAFKETLENIETNTMRADNEENSKNETLDFRESGKVDNIDNIEYSNIKFEYKVNDAKKGGDTFASVDLNSAIALINRYCGKLPSDTFTRLAPQWWIEEVRLPDMRGELRTAYICTLRMPLNCPVKYNIVGHPMPTRVLARRMVALQACRILHKSGELDNQLMPIGKENFKAAELETNVCTEATDMNDCARPGTTKRRQYYFKRTAWAFTDCQAVMDASDSDIEENPTPDLTANESGKTRSKHNILYAIVSRLWCALPERYNTRGRRLHAPQNASQAIGVLMARREPTQLQIPAFPVYTRSGEVRVSVEPAWEADVRLSPRRARLIRRFMRFVFSDVLRVRRRGMRLQAEGSTHNNYYIVPTIKKTRADGSTWVDVDWPFLELIYKHTEEKKTMELEKPIVWEEEEKKKEKEKDAKVKMIDNPLLKPGDVFTFDPDKYKEAVVTPWYRNQDQPQFFLVAEICWKLTPDSAFPSAQHASFRSYYRAKYGAELTQSCQPLLDVDHTSARLNLLTPRYVNRKGVALPVSSERTRRAKRDRLDQKQILVPELCRVHPFAAPLWFATVALPCVLYRINALLIADEIRRAVAIDVGLGIPRIDDETCPGFQWPPLDFGWSLAEVLSADSEKSDKKKDEEELRNEEKDKEPREKEEKEEKEEEEQKQIEEEKEVKEKTINDILQEKEDAESGFEIGTWSNDMASEIQQTEYDEFMEPLPANLTFCTSSSRGANWSEPIEKPKCQFNPSRTFSMADSDCSYLSSDFDTDDSDLTDGSDEDDTSGFCSSRNSNAAMGVRIEYKTAHEAEAVDVERRKPIAPAPQPDKLDDEQDIAEYKRILRAGTPPKSYVEKFQKSVAQHEEDIKERGNLITTDKPIVDLLPELTRDLVKNHVNLSVRAKTEDLNVNHKNNIEKINNFITDPNLNNENIGLIQNNVGENHLEDNIEFKGQDILNSVHDKQDFILETIDNEMKTVNDARKRFYNISREETANHDKCSEDSEDNYRISNQISKCDSKIINNELKKNSSSMDSELNLNVDTFVIDETKMSTNATDSMNNAECKVSLDDKQEVNKTTIQETNEANDINKMRIIEDIFPYKNGIELQNGEITLESIERSKRTLLADLKKSLSEEQIKKMNCFSMKDIDIDAPDYVNEKVDNVGFDTKEKYQSIVSAWSDVKEHKPYYMDGINPQNGKNFDFDYQPDLNGHPGPSPSVILQALTMSNANDGINLERLETIGDSFLKFAITAYLYCAHPAVHEGKLSHMRSKQVSNLNLYRLGRNKRLGARMIASKFEPHDNWLPPCHKPPPTLHPSATNHGEPKEPAHTIDAPVDSSGCFIPYNLITQHSIPDKSIADCVEALIGAYVLECGPRGALLFMSWLGIRVLPQHLLPLPDDHPYVVRAKTETLQVNTTTQRPPPSKPLEPLSSDSCCSDDEEVDPEFSAPEPDWSWPGRPVGALRPYQDRNGKWMQPILGELKAPPSPLLRYIEDPEGELEQMLSGYDALERTLQYRFRDRSLLLQALTHASHQKNRLTDCYQRLEFLGDAILDYLITRHLYEDPRRHSPGALTDLRSALVNNTIFATLAARHGFHKYFRHMSPGLNEVLTKYVKIQEENGHSISEEHYLIQEDEMEQAEDVEVPKALGDLFESVAGAIFLDSGMSLGAVWRSVGGLLGAELDAFSAAAPKSPVRELLEAEPDTAKFGKPERLADGRRVRVCVEVFGRGAFKGIGRNYRIAKGTAARCALRHLRSHRPR